MKDPSRVVKKGSFRIEPDGKVSRFPGLKAGVRRAASEAAARKYREIHERLPAGALVGTNGLGTLEELV